ncbi:MAG: phosphodiester glycosidase family protein [Chloroflexota bacterium]
MFKAKLIQLRNLFVARRGLILIILISLTILGGGAVYVAGQNPVVAAEIADVLRQTIGNEAVANLETTMFTVQDNVRKLEYQVTGKKAASPWSLTPVPTQVVEVTPTLPATTPNPSQPQPTPVAKSNLNLIGVSWPPPNITNRIGMLEDEGIWTPYIYDSSGRVAAYRTFLQPDKDRAYVVTAVVVFNLNVTRLGYVIGTKEPASAVNLFRSGSIPNNDRQAGVLLAAFNGGFQAQHGQFGVMYDGNIVLSGREGMGTLLLYKDGRVNLAPWDKKFYDTTEIRSWRQNGPLLVQNGEINPDTNTTDKIKSVDYWGATVDGNAVTWRSGIGLSANKQFLYYVAGPGLTVPTLANVLKSAGAKEAMQLDINPYWVQFVSVSAVNRHLKTNPLWPDMSNYQERYLGSHTSDYFYVVSHNPEH